MLSWVYLKWQYILVRESEALYNTSNAYRNAIQELDPDNELIKEIDSLNRIKYELLQENNDD